MRIEPLALVHGVDVEWNAFLLGPVFKSQGWNDSLFNIYPAKGSYMWRDMERVCASLSIPFRRPSLFPRNGLLAARIATRFKGAKWIAEFVRAIYRANFAEDSDIGHAAVVTNCLSQLNLDPQPIIAAAQTHEAKILLRAQNDIAAKWNIFGAPSFLVDGELFWGNDRLEQALQWLNAANKLS